MSAGGSMRSDLFRLIRLFRKSRSRGSMGVAFRVPASGTRSWRDVEARNKRINEKRPGTVPPASSRKAVLHGQRGAGVPLLG
jgi:hypothetical protein